MKVTHKIPIREVRGPNISMWESVEIEYENGQGLAAIKNISDDVTASFAEKPENTLGEKEMVDFLYAQIHALGNHVETWESMNAAQKTFVNQVKKALARNKPTK